MLHFGTVFGVQICENAEFGIFPCHLKPKMNQKLRIVVTLQNKKSLPAEAAAKAEEEVREKTPEEEAAAKKNE